nr:GGDEF domain-containing protein [candidate division Zixibacteria bacterium]
MIEIILILVLAVSVVALSAILLLKGRRIPGGAILDDDTVNDLIASIRSNVASGRIQDVAGSVSDILRKHLGCTKIVFLKYYRSNLELNYFAGIDNIERNSMRLRFKQELHQKLKESAGIRPLTELAEILSPEYLAGLNRFGLRYFFPVFLRDKLYGLYLIATELSVNNASLNLLAATLAFNLSAAYHIGLQEQKINRYADRIKSLTKSQNRPQRQGPSGEMLKFLRLRNCQQLVPELFKALKRDGNFSKLGFYIRTDSGDDHWMAISWNIPEAADSRIKEHFDCLVERIEPDRLFRLDDVSSLEQNMMEDLRPIIDSEVKYLLAIPWADRKKALLAWSSDEETEITIQTIDRFRREAKPLVDNISRFEKAEEMSYTDGLTGMYNFRYFKKRIHEEIQRARRYKRELSLLLFDLDDLKQVNDNYGHLAGDSLIISFGTALRETVRSNDVASRYGGDEFCLIMPETGHKDTELFMERFRRRVSSSSAIIDRVNTSMSFTVSIGGAVFPEDADTADALIHAADMALLQAKEEGGNRARMYRPEFDRKENAGQSDS